MIDLSAIALRRAAEQVESGAWKRSDKDERRNLAVVAPPLRGHPPITCGCGTCHKCRHREYMRSARSKEAPRGKSGPTLDTSRLCLRCGGKVSRYNGTGYCKACQNTNMVRRIRSMHRTRFYFTDGGGI